MDNLLNIDLEIIDSVRALHEGNWNPCTIIVHDTLEDS